MRIILCLLFAAMLTSCQKQENAIGKENTVLKDYVREPLNKAHGVEGKQEARDSELKKQADSLKD